MIVPDVNVLVFAHRSDSEQHEQIRSWFEAGVNSDSPFGLADLVVSGFLRIVTNPRIYRRPTALEVAVRFIDELVEQPTCVPLGAGPRHWEIMRRVVRSADARGNLVPDAHLAAIAIEHGGTVATCDRGFSRFANLRWVDPLAAEG